MPQAIGIFPPPPPKAQPKPTSSEPDSGNASFKIALQTAQKSTSSKSNLAARVQKAAGKTVTLPKGKPAKGKLVAGVAVAKSKTTSAKAKLQLEEPAEEEKLDDPAPASKTTTAPKTKPTAHSAAPPNSTAQASLANQGFIVHKIDDESDDEEKPKQDETEENQDAIKAIGAEDEKDSDPRDASAAEDHSAAVAQNPSASPMAFAPAHFTNAEKGSASTTTTTTTTATAKDVRPASTTPIAPADADASDLNSSALDLDLAASAPATATPAPHTDQSSFAAALSLAQPGPAPIATPATPAPHAAPTAPHTADAQFAAANHSSIITNVHAKLLPNGGSMQIRLEPPDLGPMNISVHMRDGAMTATFQTSNDEASRLLSHSLGQLKTALESTGVTVSSLHVQQTPRDSNANSQDSGKNNDSGSNNSAKDQQQEQQRKEMVRRMWKRLNGEKDPLDLMA